MDDLTALILDENDSRPTRLVYGVASGVNTVAVRGAATAVVMPALGSVQSGDYCAVLESGGDRLILGPVRSAAWTALTLAGVWVNNGGGWTDAAYRKVGDVVELRGIIKLSSGSVATGVDSLITTLLAGFRPVSLVMLSALSYSGTANQAVQLRLSTTGTINYRVEGGSTLTTSGWVSLEGAQFSTL